MTARFPQGELGAFIANKSYTDFSLTDVSFSLPDNSFTGFIGVNGSGKTTTIRSILGLVKFNSGIIKLFGQDINRNIKVMPVQYQFGYDKSKLIFVFLLIAFPLLIAITNTTMVMEILSKITFPVMLILALSALLLSVILSIKIFNGKEL